MSGWASPELVDLLKLRGEREGVEWVRAVVNLRMSQAGGGCLAGEQQSAVDADRRRAGHRALNASQLAGAERRAKCGPALRPNTPASAPHFAPDPAAEVSRL